MQNNQITSMKTELSLVALLCLAPLVQRHLRTRDEELSADDLVFIKGYIILGNINLILLILICGLGAASMLGVGSLFSFAYLSISVLLSILFIIGTICVFTDIPVKILQTNKQASINTDQQGIVSTTLAATPSSTSAKQILLSYLPGYNIWLWYHLHEFTTPDLILKESLLVRLTFGGMCFLTTSTPAIILLLLIGIRVVTLINQINLFPDLGEKIINMGFSKNPEELWGVVTGTIVWLLSFLKNKPESLRGCIQNQQIDYSFLYDVHQYRFILLQYILGGLGLLYLLVNYYSVSNPFIWIACGLLLSRYAIMSLSWARLPQLPLAKEIVDSIQGIIHFISHRLHHD